MKHKGTKARRLLGVLVSLWLIQSCSKVPAQEIHEVRIPRGAGGVGFLPLLVMEKYNIVEQEARDLGIKDLKVKWIDLGGPAVMNDSLLSGAVDFIAAGPPAFIILWDRTQDSAKVKGAAAMSSLPMYLNARSDRLKKLDDVTDQDKIAVTSVKVSIPSIIMQMYASAKYGPDQFARFDKYTVTMTHPDGVIGLLSGSGGISAHFTSPPFHQRERKDPKVRTIMTSDEVMGGSTTFTMISTTTAFREKNPKIYQAVLKALDDAIDSIIDDKEGAAEILLASAPEGGFSRDELVALLKDPNVKFTTTPENVMKYADFMQRVGSIKKRPNAWQDMFFAEVHDMPGS
jgi:NitT/TauT family transport system substrate-binding protein